MRACKSQEETSTPQMILVTVTYLVRAIGSLATVRSCVPMTASPTLIHGGHHLRDNGRRRHAGDPKTRVPRRNILSTVVAAIQIQGNSEQGLRIRKKRGPEHLAPGPYPLAKLR